MSGPGVPVSARSRRSRSTWHRIWWWAGWVLLAPVEVALAQDPSSWPEILIGPVVITVWRTIAAAYAVGVACWILSLIARGPGREASHPPVTPPRTSLGTIRRILGAVRRVITVLVTAATLLWATGTGAISLWIATADRYHVLSPASPGGCRVVSRVDMAAIKGIAGDVLLAVPGSPVLRDTGANWSTRHGQVDPFRTGNWTLSWDGPTALLSVWLGDPSDLVLDPHARPSELLLDTHAQPSAPIRCPR